MNWKKSNTYKIKKLCQTETDQVLKEKGPKPVAAWVDADRKKIQKDPHIPEQEGIRAEVRAEVRAEAGDDLFTADQALPNTGVTNRFQEAIASRIGKSYLCPMKRTIFYLCLLWIPCIAAAHPGGLLPRQVRYTPEDQKVYEKVMKELLPLRSESMPVLIMKAAETMLDIPYVGGTLEQTPEMLTVSLAQTDCILLVEACVCMALTARQEDNSFEAFCENLRHFRYRDGFAEGYDSRIHYTSEWIRQAEERDLALEMSRKLSGTRLDQTFSYMSVHADRYPVLAGNKQLTERIAMVEKELTGNKYYYIPKAQLEESLDQIQHGDMICFVSGTEGLDITHVAFAFESYVCEHDCCPDGRGCPNGQRRLGFLHASSLAKRVVVDDMTLTGYVNTTGSCKGIRIVRFL
ncbi:MAG: N-acetylmuramoyl-L-alanine amidase-like domain-containing protein [Bacteroidales bacterium]